MIPVERVHREVRVIPVELAPREIQELKALQVIPVLLVPRVLLVIRVQSVQ